MKDGIISPKAGSFNDKIILQCRPGYMEDGPSTITCQADGNWTTRIGWCKKSEDSKIIQLLKFLCSHYLTSLKTVDKNILVTDRIDVPVE